MADAVEEIEREGGNRAVKDLFAGAVGGVAQVLIGESTWRIRGVTSRTSETTKRARHGTWFQRMCDKSLLGLREGRMSLEKNNLYVTMAT